MNRLITVPVVVLLLVSIIFTGCAPTTATVKPIELILSTYDPPSSAFTVALQQWGEEIEAATAGRVKCTMYHSESLGKASQHYDMALSGAADVVKFATSYTPGRFPLTEIGDLPFLFPL